MKLKIPYWYLLLGPTIAHGVGFGLNALVMAVNHAQMPVLMPGGDVSLLNPDDLLHCAMTAQTHLKFLADWIVIKDSGIASPGDFLLWFYELTFMPSLVAWVTCIIKDKHREY